MKRWFIGSAMALLVGWSVPDQVAADGVLHNAQYAARARQAPSLQAAVPVSWQYYRPAERGGGTRQPAADRPRAEAAERQFGYPTHADPLFDTGTRPDWQMQHLERPRYDRPTYAPPNVDKPLYGLDPIRKPTYEKPLAVLPDDSKPSNQIRNYEAPGWDRPTEPLPYNRGPNYVIRPEMAPAYEPRVYDHPFYDRPERLPPVYEPEEYKRPQDLPPPYIAPPK